MKCYIKYNKSLGEDYYKELFGNSKEEIFYALKSDPKFSDYLLLKEFAIEVDNEESALANFEILDRSLLIPDNKHKIWVDENKILHVKFAWPVTILPADVWSIFHFLSLPKQPRLRKLVDETDIFTRLYIIFCDTGDEVIEELAEIENDLFGKYMKGIDINSPSALMKFLFMTEDWPEELLMNLGEKVVADTKTIANVGESIYPLKFTKNGRLVTCNYEEEEV